MPQSPSGVASAAGAPGAASSVSGAEGNATSSAPPSSTTTAPAPPKLRSCVVCRSRKVRCNKESPCANCRRANIPCVFPSADRPPRWARRLERITSNAAAGAKAGSDADPATAQVMERLRNLEGLVKELSGQLEQAHSAAQSNAGSEGNSPGNSAHGRDADHAAAPSGPGSSSIQKQFGRMVINDPSRSRYLHGLKMDTRGIPGDDSDSSEDDESSPGKTSSTQELDRTPAERHAFLFRHNLNANGPDLRDFEPLPSQVPFLLDIFSENVNAVAQIVHMPTIRKMARYSRGNDASNKTLANQALMFSIYYAAITSMEDEDVLGNFGSTKADLNMKYRLGLEHALAKADFLNVPDTELVQAFVIFLMLSRRHDSPRFVWMMTGLVIRMAQALGLHRDGTNFPDLSPFEVEMRRRIWWALCNIDTRSSEDQGTDMTIIDGSFDTKIPTNINDEDLGPDIKTFPTAREGLTDSSFSIVWSEMNMIARRMAATGLKDGNLGDVDVLSNAMFEILERVCGQYLDKEGNMLYWAGFVIVRLVIAKMTLLTHMPVLFSAPDAHSSDEMRNKLLVAAIEIAEHNHALNAEQAVRHWRWFFQTYTHWYAIVYILIEVSNRPWSPTVERAWSALQSPWLIPAQSNVDKNLRIWVPLRKLMAKARKHRITEMDRLRGESWSVQKLEAMDREHPVPAVAPPYSAEAAADLFREKWRRLILENQHIGNNALSAGQPTREGSAISSSSREMPAGQAQRGLQPQYLGDPQFTNAKLQPEFISAGPSPVASVSGVDMAPSMPYHNTTPFSQPATAGLSYAMEWGDGRSAAPWLWADTDPTVNVFENLDVDAMDINMDLDSEVDWYTWVESAKGMEWNAGQGTGGAQ
ncbi:hypothetical protein JX265_007299 [Neoarthrinium moseri]|uniref:Zn(2)-C6 fungal-type domain-containing protein n=1 Tax=Neoarthrinium moseri TaxID=1658444 RepID=A0A9P9WKB5_9PEZI|nr:hypothetical protein JX265_007299 [Neoarthrinium moseri]